VAAAPTAASPPTQLTLAEHSPCVYKVTSLKLHHFAGGVEGSGSIHRRSSSNKGDPDGPTPSAPSYKASKEAFRVAALNRYNESIEDVRRYQVRVARTAQKGNGNRISWTPTAMDRYDDHNLGCKGTLGTHQGKQQVLDARVR